MKRILILGASGLVGQQLLQQALAQPEVQLVIAPTRRALPAHARLLNPIVDYEQLPEDAEWWQADAVLCALGTTMRQAGSASAFRRVDHSYVLAAARLAQAAGTPVFVLNSSLGADQRSSNLYLRVKGETEQALNALGFRSLTLVRPSLLDGGPRPDSRPAETMALCMARLLGPLVPRRWRPVPTSRVAQAMLGAAMSGSAGTHIIESSGLHD